MSVTDLNGATTSKMALLRLFLEENPAPREPGLCSIDGSSADAHLSALRRTLRGESQGPIIQLSRPIPLYGLCSMNLPRKPSGYRGLSSCARSHVRPHGDSWRHLPQHARQRQHSPRLENVRRLCPAPEQDGPAPLCPRRLRARSPEGFLGRFIEQSPQA